MTASRCRSLLLFIVSLLSFSSSAENWLTSFTSDAMAGGLQAAAKQGDWVYVGGSIGSVGTQIVPSVIGYNLTTGERRIEPAELSMTITSLLFFDQGNGPILHAATPSGVWALENGQWTEIGSLSSAGTGAVYDLEVFDFGNGPQLVAAGDIFIPNLSGPTINGVVVWTGNEWEKVGPTDLLGDGFAMTLWNDGGQERLAVLGAFTIGADFHRLLVWNGADWDRPAASFGGLFSSPIVIDTVPGPTGENLLFCGDFNQVEGVDAIGIARWDGQAWFAIPGAENPFNRRCSSLVSLPENDSLALLFGDFVFDGTATESITDPAQARPPWVKTADGTVLALGNAEGRSVAVRTNGAWEYPETAGGSLLGWKIERITLTDEGAQSIVMAGRFQRLDDGARFDIVRWDGETITGLANIEQTVGFPPTALSVHPGGVFIVAGGFSETFLVSLSDSQVTVSDQLPERARAVATRNNDGQLEVFLGTDDGVRRWANDVLEEVGVGGPTYSVSRLIAIDPSQPNGGLYANAGQTSIDVYDGVAWSASVVTTGPPGLRFLQEAVIDGVSKLLTQVNPGGLIGQPGENFLFDNGSWTSLGVSAAAGSGTAVRIGEQDCYFVGAASKLERNCGAGYEPLPETMMLEEFFNPFTTFSSGFVPRYKINVLTLGTDNQRIFVANPLTRVGNVASAGAGTFDPKVITLTGFE